MNPADMFLARKLKLYQLVVFDQVVRDGSMLYAARTLNLTQPAVSKVIHELEGYFEGQLLIRGNRGVTTTELGELVLARTKPLLRELQALSDEANSFVSGTAGNVVVGSLISASKWLLPEAIKQLKKHTPSVMVSLKIGQMNQLFPELAVGDLDLVVSRVPDNWQSRTESRDLEVEVLYEETLSLVAGPNHPLHGKVAVTLDDMHAFPWVLPTRESLFRNTADRLFAEAGLSTPANVVESLSILTNLSLLADQQTICFMPTEIAQQFDGTGLLSILDFHSNIHFGAIGCFYPASGTLRPAARRFRESLENVARDLQPTLG